MEYKEDKIVFNTVEEHEDMPLSQLIIEDNTIYEIDLECQYRKGNSCKECMRNKKSGGKRVK